MTYFTLNYVAPTLQEGSPYFTINDGLARITTTHMQSLHALIQHILSNHLICMSVPPSFPLDLTCHQNTILILQEALYPLITILRATSLPLSLSFEGQFAVSELESTFSCDLSQANLAEFEQPLPIVVEDIISSSLSERSSTCMATSAAISTIPASYNLPSIQISPDGKRFTLILYPVTTILDYLKHLHQGIQYVLENSVFMSDSSTITMLSATSLDKHSLLSLLQLLIEQSKNITLVTDVKEQENITQSHQMWIYRLTTKLKLSGFSDTSLASMWPASLQRKLISPFIETTTFSLSAKKPPLKKKYRKTTNPLCIPLFYICAVNPLIEKNLKEPTIYVLKYIVRKINNSSSPRYSDIRSTINKTSNLIKDICSSTITSPKLFCYIEPVSNNSMGIDQDKMFSLLFEGLTENLTFLPNKFPTLMQSTFSYNPKTILENSLALVKKQLKSVPAATKPHILQNLYQQTKLSTRTPMNICLTKKIPSKKQTFSVSLFGIRLKSGPTSLNKLDPHVYLIRHYVHSLKGHLNQILIQMRISIELTEKHIKELCLSQESICPIIQYLDPVSKEKSVLPLLTALTYILDGLNKNMTIFEKNLPLILKNHRTHHPLKSLQNSIALVSNKLDNDIPLKNI
ncbi:hypothetical protein CLAVI_000995 [Candidatus Clavichlamydia salmonicola]|uniref:hypothetical protein n=1 Tax=Candidatus Clavichlamydia salmonicola TaxID=469812 RepID=UPI0018914B20|nr:hypothetical protein [Candidatus Clavichlamydia salmonicola]MBF5051352.1 hypothetical protein [Candidatus Clavichlamydia salmonicola]